MDELNQVREVLGKRREVHAYALRHGILSQPVLTITDDKTAAAVAEYLAPDIVGKTVVEIGGGIGLLALHMGTYAKRVFCIEADPLWATSFTTAFYATKPRNVSFLFGAAQEFAEFIKADVAVFCTHSGVDAMQAAAMMFAPVTVDVYGRLIAANPSAFDPTASRLRSIS